MLHPRFQRLRAFADDELTPRQRARAATHLTRCSDCRSIIGWLRAVRERARAGTELTAPSAAWSVIAERMRSGEVALAPVAAPPEPAPRLSRAVTTGIVLLIVASAVTALVTRDALFERFVPPASAPPTPAPLPAPSPFTEIVVPADRNDITVQLDAAGSGLRLRVRLSDAAELGVRATGAAAAAQFRSGPGRVFITRAANGEIVLDVPRRLANLRVEVEGQLWLAKQGELLLLRAPAVDTVGGEFLIPVR
jgi:hypothetical protein